MKAKFHRGFTLFEMMVAIAIFVIITTIAVLNYRRFGNDVFIKNLAYDMALSIRKAQSYGINVQSAPTGGFTYAYGVHFETITPTQYKLFVDTHPLPPGGTPDKKRTILPDPHPEDVETFNLLKGSTIDKLCATPTSGSENCTISTLDITFLRPNPDAIIITNVGGTYKSARICIKSTDNEKKQIIIYNIGQISVQDSCP